MFHPVIHFPEPPLVLDLTNQDPANFNDALYTIGRYDEHRPGLYKESFFTEDQRDLHVGIDIGAPAHTPIHAFAAGQIVDFRDNARRGDYGPTLITQHQLEEKALYVLWGHLSRASLQGKDIGQRLEAGEVFAWLGSEEENGGWAPHVHIQLCWEKPEQADLPGVVALRDREEALQKYPDPRLILGPIY